MNMKSSAILLVTSCLAVSAYALDLAKQPPLPEKPIAVKKELLFSDDFKGAEHDKRWHRVVDTFAFENGALKGTQTRDQNIPAADGKPEVKAHAAVYGLEVPTKDSVIEAKIRFDGATMIDVEFDDRKFTGSHYGHIARAQAKLNGVTILDERRKRAGKSSRGDGQQRGALESGGLRGVRFDCGRWIGESFEWGEADAERFAGVGVEWQHLGHGRHSEERRIGSGVERFEHLQRRGFTHGGQPARGERCGPWDRNG